MSFLDGIDVNEYNSFKSFVTNCVVESRDGEIQLTQGDNGGIIPTSIANKIVEVVKDRIPWLALCNVFVVNGKLSVPCYNETDEHFIDADYVDEGVELIDNIGSFQTVDLSGYLIGALSLVSKKLIRNTSIDIVEFVVYKIAESIVKMLDKEFCVGTSKISGITNCSNIVVASSLDAITLDEIITLSHSIPDMYRYSFRTCWLMNPKTYTAICKLADNSGRKVIDNNGFLFNQPVYMSNNMPSIDGDNVAIVFGDMSGYDIKFDSELEVKILREKFAAKNLDGFVCFGEFDGKITDSNKIAVLRMKSISRDLSRSATNCSVSVTIGEDSVTDGNDVLNDFDVVTITATADSGYVVTSLTVNGEDFVSGSDLTVMDDVDIVAVASAYRDLSVTADEHCHVTVTRNGIAVDDGDNALVDGDSIVISVSADDGYEIDTFTVNNEAFVSGNDLTVSENVVIVAESSQIVGGE